MRQLPAEVEVVMGFQGKCLGGRRFVWTTGQASSSQKWSRRSGSGGFTQGEKTGRWGMHLIKEGEEAEGTEAEPFQGGGDRRAGIRKQRRRDSEKGASWEEVR